MINFNMATKIHRDEKDKNFCVIIVISENCRGGDLCLEELGVKFSLASGDVIIFPSEKISHFNTHFKGGKSFYSSPYRWCCRFLDFLSEFLES